MDEVFDKILETEKGKEILFSIISTAIAYKQATLTPHNPLVKQIGAEPLKAQQLRKLLFQNLAEFERLITELYTFDGSVSFRTDDLTSDT
jgi:hypothetical protein